MKRITVLGLALVALAALAVMGATGASAKEKKVLTLSTKKGALKAGAEITDFSSNLITKTKSGNLECEKSTLNWKLASNESATDKGSSEEDIETGEYEGIPGGCKSSIGAAKVKAELFPWSISVSDNGKGEIKGTKKVKFAAEWVGGVGKGIACAFEASTVKFAITTSGPVKITVKEQKFKVAKGSNAACPKEGELSGEYGMTSEGETVEAKV